MTLERIYFLANNKKNFVDFNNLKLDNLRISSVNLR